MSLEEPFEFEWQPGTKASPPKRFSVEIDEPGIVRITAWLVSGDSTPQLYADIENEKVGAKKAKFRNVRKAEENVISVAPQDPLFACSTWHIAVESHDKTKGSRFGIKVSLQEPKPVRALRSG